MPEICWEEVAEEILSNIRVEVWLGIWTLALRLIDQYTNYYTMAIMDSGCSY